MVRHFAAIVILAWAWVPSALAGPVTLKLAYFSSDRTTTYVAVVKPFLDAVNAGGQGIVQIEPHLSGVLGKEAAQQAELVLNGTADLAYAVAGMTRARFADNYIIEMPGFYRDMREATLVYTRLVAANALRGYEEFFVVGAFVT